MINWAYIAGFLDGDGWITVSKNKNANTKRYTVGLTQSKKRNEAMIKIYKFIQRHRINATFFERTVNTIIKANYPMINIHIKEQKSLIKILKFLIPFLLIKKKLAIEAFNYTKERIIKRDNGYIYTQKKKKYWRLKEIKKLIILKKQGYGDKSIAKILKRNSDSISHKLYRIRKNPE
jgi:hypothetical protein